MSDFKKGLTIGILIASSVFLLTAQTSLKKYQEGMRKRESIEKINKQQEITATMVGRYNLLNENQLFDNATGELFKRVPQRDVNGEVAYEYWKKDCSF
jgi:hypothetical protein